MKIKRHFSLLVLAVLVGLTVGLYASPMSVQANSASIIQISPTGQGRAHAVAYSPDGKDLVVGSSLGITFYNANSLETIRFIQTDNWVRSLAFSPDGSLLASGSYDPVVRLWRVNDGSLFKELVGHTGWVRSIVFSPDGNLLATASDDNTVRLWNIPSGDLSKTLNQSVDGTRILAFSPDGSILATSGIDNTIRFWNVFDGKLLRELTGHTGWVRSLAFSPNGEYLASGAFDATVRLWSVADGSLLVTRHEHASSVLGLAFSPDGTLLASGSVDKTVRLWSMPSLEPYYLMKDHTDFVYSVAFSPDGRSVASGSVDNTVRVWDVPTQADPAAFDLVTSPSNCKTCHHPFGLQGPPRVIEPTCAVCHKDGAQVLNWCPSFARSPGGTSMKVQLQPLDYSGFYHPKPSATITINYPGNGEVVYGQADISYPLKVLGQVYYQGEMSDIKLTLEIFSEDGSSSTVETTPFPDGTYTFQLEGNHSATLPVSLLRNGISIAGEAPCLVCHKDVFDGILPERGSTLLRVTMSNSSGIQASDERTIFVDDGGIATIPVRVLLDSGQVVTGLPIRAETRLYEWRGRSFTSLSDANGQTILKVEALSQNPTYYNISIPPTVINGILYESKESQPVTLLPGAASAPEVTLQVKVTSGQISGQIGGLSAPVQVWAINLPGGTSYQATSSVNGKFTFQGLPVSQYLLAVDTQVLAEQGLTANSEKIDLTHSNFAQVDLLSQPLTGASLNGKITAPNNAFLPFAWVSTKTELTQVDSSSGTYALFGLPAGKLTVFINAPGYYSQANLVIKTGSSSSNQDFSLALCPETQTMPWGNGSMVIPSETVASLDGNTINFEQGWLWGEGKSDQPVTIAWGDLKIEMTTAKFALERRHALPTWLNVMDGQASITWKSSKAPVIVGSGQMVYLHLGLQPQPVPYDPVVVDALRINNDVPIDPTWQPSVNAQVRDRLARIGIGTAQLVTYITYFMEVIALLVLLFFAINWLVHFLKEKNRD
jgi:uncharacterized protein with WD repeat